LVILCYKQIQLFKSYDLSGTIILYYAEESHTAL